MIDKILKSISFIFHPILMPILGVIFYFSKTPRFFPVEIIRAKLISLSILTIILPILIYYLLKTIKKVDTIYLETAKERIFPLALNAVILLLIIQRVLPASEINELFFFYIGVLISTLICLLFAVFKFKASIHMIALAGIFMFAIALSIFFSININGTLALFVLIIGAVATSRLHVNAHTYKELIVGFFIGFVPQLVLLWFWF